MEEQTNLGPHTHRLLAVATGIVIGVGSLLVYQKYTRNDPTVLPEVQAIETQAPAPAPVIVVATANATVSNPRNEADQVVISVADKKGLVSGAALGTMYFEGSFPITFTSPSGTVLAMGIATATSDWMTTSSVPFTATLEFDKPVTADTVGVLVLSRDNPSGLPEQDLSVSFPAILKK